MILSVEEQNALFAAAMRVVPAVAKHRANNDVISVAATYEGFIRDAMEAGVYPPDAWCFLATAAQVWMGNLFEMHAAATGKPVEEVIAAAVAAGVDVYGG